MSTQSLSWSRFAINGQAAQPLEFVSASLETILDKLCPLSTHTRAPACYHQSGPKVGSGSSSAPQVGAKPPGVVDPFASSSTRTRPPRSPPPQAMAGSAAAREESEREEGGAGIGGQRARSMAMVTEGLEVSHGVI